MVSPQESARLPEKEANNDQKEEEEEEKETKKKDMFLCEGGSYKAEGEFEDPSRSKLRISLSREGAKVWLFPWQNRTFSEGYTSQLLLLKLSLFFVIVVISFCS